ncbi:EF-P 5-aminopentanol modification-associated protein YfmH [Lacticaseibacillus thailandensis]|uniref:EF-P 5-aminopentanol modification-associated protein YfmH n=1 Tax=Lacticaseibacillus thailandensis TaxID=381741 RepID=UPI000AF4FB08|nr:pitrilysin family protein [Lacticaseibacillus thailandensis]
MDDTTKRYADAGETLRRVTLPNGLRLQIVVKPEYHKTYAVFTTNFGAVDDQVRLQADAQPVVVPAGTAHFLEHKLFDKADYDAFDLFGASGASANAFTSATNTNYLFSTTRNVMKNVEILLDFVQDPYFTDATVAKEQGIIGQEIQMYDDDPNWQAYTSLLADMYPGHPLSQDIAGTVDSISHITPAILRTMHQAFYHPQNMVLTVVGNFDADELIRVVSANQAGKVTAPAPQARITHDDYDVSVVQPYSVKRLDIVRPKGYVGIKGSAPITADRAGLRQELATRLFLELIFGDSGHTYTDWYDQGVIDDTFGYEFNVGRGYNFTVFSGDATDPNRMTNAIMAALRNYRANPDVNVDRLARIIKASLASTLPR